MHYYINGKTVLLKKSEGIVINSRVMHYGYAFHDADCSFICILFHPDLLANNKAVYRQYVLPLLDQSVWEYLHLSEDSNASLLSGIRTLWELKAQAVPGYELEAIGQLYFLWREIGRLASSMTPCYRYENDPGILVMRQSPLDYINQYRLQAAASLLLSTDMKITDISTRCGFSHHSYFAKLFARSMGCSPSAYRRENARTS